MDDWQSGDVVAFEALFRQYERLIFRNAYLVTGSKDEAKDVLQEVFLSVWNSRGTFDARKGKITTWLHRITANKCSKNYQNRRKKGVDTISIEGVGLPIMKSMQPEEILISRNEYDKLLEALNSMDYKHRSVMVLRFFHDLPYSDIAKILNIPLGTVKSRLNKALADLKVRISTGQCEA